MLLSLFLKRNHALAGFWLFSATVLLFLIPNFSIAAQQSIQLMRSVKVVSVDESAEQIRFPSSISYDPDGDEIYVTVPQKSKLVVLTPDYFPYISIGRGRGLHSINKTYIKNGLLYVCLGSSVLEARPHIAIFDMAFMPVKKIYFPEMPDFSPRDLAVSNNGILYVVGLNRTGVMVLDTDGRFLRSIEPKDDVLDVVERATISSLDIDMDGRLYLLSEAMGRVYVYSPQEIFLYKFGEKGGEPGTLSRPRGIAVDEIRGHVYLVDYQRHTLSVYSMSGEYLFEVGGMGSGLGWFYYPSDLIVDGRGRVVVADTFNHRLQVFEFVNDKGFGRRELMTDSSPRPLEQVLEVISVDSIEMSSPLADDAGSNLVLTAMSRSLKNADALVSSLRRKGYPVLAQHVERSKSGVWYQVLVGPYVDPLDAYAAMQKLQADEQLPAVLKTSGPAFDLKITADPIEDESAAIVEDNSVTKEVILPSIDVPAFYQNDESRPKHEVEIPEAAD